MKHPIYAILLAAIIFFTFWSEIPVNNTKRLEEKNKIVSIEKNKNVSSADSLSSKAKENKKDTIEIINKNVLSLKENKLNADSAITNISLPSDKQ